MSSIKTTSRHPPGEDEEYKTPRVPVTKEPEPDVPDTDDEIRELVKPVHPVQVSSEVRPHLWA